uniref:Uncharacterized protein n=1 Tax=Panagrolaimus sp. ES5 TaxID=591445 RepID=A0AC34GW51_9BILA
MGALKIATFLFLGFLAISVVYVSLSGAPAVTQVQTKETELTEKLSALQQQITEIQNAIGGQVQVVQQQPLPPQGQQQLLSPQQPLNNLLFNQPRPYRSAAWQPMKRMVAWQPMKRSDSIISNDLQRDQLLRAIESQLSDVLHAGETLGITAEEVLAHLRQRNDNTY